MRRALIWLLVITLCIGGYAWASGSSPGIPKKATQAEMEAGTETALRSVSPALLKMAIDALGAGSGDVESSGDCLGGACYDGSSDGGTYMRLYDGNSHYTGIAAGDSTANLTFTFPTAYPAGTYLMSSTVAGVLAYVDPATYQAADATLTDIADGTIAEDLVNTANPWAVNEGGTGAATFTDHGILVGSGTAAITPLGVASNGQIPVGSAGADPVLANITETGDALTVTNGAGTIDLAAHANVEALADGAMDLDNASGDTVDDDKLDQAAVAGFGPSATPTVTLQDSDNEAGTAAINANSSGGANDIILTVGVEDSAGESSAYVEFDGVTETVDVLKPLVITGTQLKIPSSDADPTATAGYLRHDSTVSNHANGAVRWHDGTNIRQAVDMVAATAEACTDDQVVAYDADADLFYCKADANSGSETAMNAIGDAAADGTIALGGYKIDWTSTLNTAGAVLKLANTVADLTADVSLFDLAFTDDGDANGFFMRGYDNAAGDLAWSIGASGAISLPLAGGYIAGGADPADSGLIRLSNNTALAWEQSTPGDDIFIALDGSDILQVGQNAAAIYLGTSGTGNVTVTGDLTVTGSDVSVGVAGVKLTGDGDGAITFLGLGDGYDEDLTINLDDTENTAVVSSSTGVTTVSFSALNMATTGTILGATNIVVTTDGTESPTAVQMYGSMFIADHGTATSDTDYTLPAVAAGMVACFYDNGGGTGGIIIDPDASDVILLDGTALTAGNAIDSPGVAGDGANGDFICMMGIDDTNWITLGKSGTFVDGGAD